MEKTKRMEFYGGTVGACLPMLVFLALMVVIAVTGKVSLVLFFMAGFMGLCTAFFAGEGQKGI